MPDTDVAIRVEKLSKVFQVPHKTPGLRGAIAGLFHRRTQEVEAVSRISFSIKRGELVGFLGPNGAGKTTTLKMLSGLLHPSEGTAEVLGHIPWKRERDFQKRFTMVMGQRTQLWWDLPAWDSFLLNKEIFQVPTAQFNATVEELASILEIKDLLEVPVKKLSLGQRMKAELICSLLHSPEVLFLDEPTIGLDVVMQQKVRDFIRAYNARRQATVLITSHNMDDIAELCPRVILINQGRVLFDGTLETLTQRIGKADLTEAMRVAFELPDILRDPTERPAVDTDVVPGRPGSQL